MKEKQNEKIQVIDILQRLNYLDEDTVAEAKKTDSKSPVSYLIKSEIITQELVGQAIGEYYNVPYTSLGMAAIPRNTLDLLPQQVSSEMRVAVMKKESNEVTLATDSPENIEVNRELIKDIFGESTIIKFHYTLPNELDEVLKGYESTIKEVIENIISTKGAKASQIFAALLEQSLEQNVSDIHFEPREGNLMIRFRIDGSLIEVTQVSKEIYNNLVNHIKILAKLRIDKHFSPQDGAIRFRYKKTKVDLRVSLVPVIEGEKTVIRILSNSSNRKNLDDLGLSDKGVSLIKKALLNSYGMILTTGPTGSGKTTTLYSVLRQLNQPDVNITTIEDPVEYRVDGINQIQVDADNNITFASGLRSVVRQDPNIILVGEIRDIETAEIAVNASLTGHLLLSSFHANDAASTIPRLLEMGTENFLLSSTLKLIIAQRLVRRTCTYCKVSHDYTKAELQEMVPDAPKYFPKTPLRLYRGNGCSHCNGTSYLGRIGIYEMIYVTEAIQEKIIKRAASQEIWETAKAEGATSFFEEGLAKVNSGIVSIEELVRVAPQTYDSGSIYN